MDSKNSEKEKIASIIRSLEVLVRKMADSREEISENEISKAFSTLNDIEGELQMISGQVAKLKFEIEGDN